MVEFDVPRLRRPGPAINIAPLVDVLLLLLIFFMVTSTFVEQPNIKLELPRTRHSKTTPLQRLVLIVSRRGEYFLDAERIEKSRLERRLRQEVGRSKDKTLVLRADRAASYGDVIWAMDAARGAGFRKIVAPTRLDRASTNDGKPGQQGERRVQ